MNNRNHYTTDHWRKKDIVLTQVTLSIFGIFLGVAFFCLMVLMFSPACAEEMPTYRCWALCEPGSEVMIREKPGKLSTAVGSTVSGAELRTDWEESGNWIHLVELNNETGEGWISLDYVVFDEPVRLDMEGAIKGKGRVACRKCIGGKRKAWASAGSEITVYWWSAEWCVTDRGYIQSKFVEIP